MGKPEGLDSAASGEGFGDHLQCFGTDEAEFDAVVYYGDVAQFALEQAGKASVSFWLGVRETGGSRMMSQLDSRFGCGEILRRVNEVTKQSGDSGIRLLTRAEAETEDRTFWHSKTPEERWAAAEQLRQIAYGYDPSARISAVVEFVERKRGLSTWWWAVTR